jgi:undecaprenyl-diphosphatase
MPYLRDLISCGGWFSFPSNHATNHFGLAAFWFGAIWRIKGQKWYWLWAWALLICFGQVYVGKHFPLDILAGALYGITIATGSLWIFRNRVVLQAKASRMLRLKKAAPRAHCQ